MKIACQYLYMDGIIVEPDTTCPECGKPWKEGASYGHNYCCGCVTCGYSYALLDSNIENTTDEEYYSPEFKRNVWKAYNKLIEEGKIIPVKE